MSSGRPGRSTAAPRPRGRTRRVRQAAGERRGSRRRKPKSELWASTMNGSWASRNSTNSRARWIRPVPAYSRSSVRRGSSQRHPLLASEAANEAPDHRREVVRDGQLMTERPERDQHLEVADDARRHRQLVLADRLEDVDGELRVRVLGRPGRPRSAGGDPRAVGDRVVQERLVDADQLPARRRRVRRRSRAPASASARGRRASTSPRNSSQL